MPLVSQDIRSLIGGVSEQPAEVRKTSQVSVAENVTLSPSKGLSKRAGSEVLTTTALPNQGLGETVEWLPFNGGAGHKHAIRVTYSDTESSIYSVALDGPNKGQYTLVANDTLRTAAAEYLHGTQRLAHTTIGTSIFLANDQKVVAQGGVVPPAPPNEYIVHIKQPPTSVDRKSFAQLSIESSNEEGQAQTVMSFLPYNAYDPNLDNTDPVLGGNPEIATLSSGNAATVYGQAVLATGNWNAVQWGNGSQLPDVNPRLNNYKVSLYSDEYQDLVDAFNIAAGNTTIQAHGTSLLSLQLPGAYGTIEIGAAPNATPVAGTSWNNWEWTMLNYPAEPVGEIQTNLLATPTGTIIKGTHYDNRDFSVLYGIDEQTWRVKEGDDSNIILFSREAGPTIEDLPATCFDGFQTRVTTDPDSESEYYFLQFVEEDNAWVERAKEGEIVEWDATTLPHILRYDFDTASFSYEPYTWEARKCGDVESHREPSFLGQTINDMTFYQDRLVLASGYNVIFSEAQEPGNFWRQSMVALLDNDRLDLEMNATENGSGIVHSITVTPDGVLAGSDRSQALITSGGEAFTGSNVRVELLGSQAMSPYTKPVISPSSTFFVAERGNSSQLWEYTILGAKTALPVNVTGHCPDLLAGIVTDITSDSANNEIVCTMDSGRVFVYRYLTEGEQRLQAAWAERTSQLVSVTEGTFAVADTMYEATAITVVEVLPEDHVDPCGWAVHGDLRQPVVLDSTAATNQGARYTLELNDQGGLSLDWRVLDLDTGAIVPFTSGSAVSAPTIALNPAENNLVWSMPIEMNVELSELIMRNPQDQSPILGGRSQVRTLSLRYDETGTFTVHTDIGGEVEAQSHTMTNQETTNAFGPPAPSGGEFITDIGGNSTETTIRITSDDPYPTNFTSARYEVLFYRRGN